MNPNMNLSTCIPEERLAAYFDRELAPDERPAVERHLHVCGLCRRKLDEMALVRSGIRSISSPAPPDALWTAIEDALAAHPRRSGPRRGHPGWAAERLREAAAPARVRPRGRRIAAAAALVAVILTSILLISRSEFSGLEEVASGGDVLFSDRDGALPVLAASAPFNLGPYLQALDRTGRLPSFPDAYRQTPVSASDAIWNVARKVELDWAALPPELVLEGASMIERSTFRMAQLVFSHPGGKVVLFVQPRRYTISFADNPTEPTVIGRRRCLKVRCGDYRAFCFRTSEATYTVVGRYDDPMLEIVYSAV